MRGALAGLLAGLAALAAGRAAEACAGCSNPNLPVVRAESAALAPGEASAALHLTATTMRVVHDEACPDIGPVCAERAEPPQRHDQRFYVAELRPVVALGVAPGFAVELQAPVRLVTTTIVFRRLDGTPFEPDYQNIHHRDETLAGVADPWLLARATRGLGRLAVTSRAGLGLPLGRTEEDPFARGRAGLRHQHIQFGTGTFYPVLALDASLALAPFRLSGYGQALLFLYENGHGYRAGNRYMGGLSGDAEVAKNLRLGAGADLLHERPERWGGVVQQDGNVGRTDLLVGGTASYAFGAVTASVAVKVPVYQHFLASHDHGGDPGQLTYPAIVNLALQARFGGPPREPAPAAPAR
ncbi:MAG TPA: hypothetical protein VFS43_46660 [Polyangiaceae bacterium]|nr:hypothetical protein [Polyangiaceae bacterium]